MSNREKFRYKLTDLDGNIVMDNATAEEVSEKYYISKKAIRHDALNNGLLLHQYHVTRKQVIFPKRFTVIDENTGKKIAEHANGEAAAKAIGMDNPAEIWNAANRGYTIRKHYKVIIEHDKH